MKNYLLLIDPQYDFCSPNGALSVPGAEEDCERIAELINVYGSNIDRIFVSLDSHHKFDVAHPTFYINKGGEHPAPFTIISSNDLETGVWTTKVPEYLERTIKYTKELEAGGKFPLCIWPEHCLIGSLGATIMPVVMDPLNKWCEQGKTIEFIHKGRNIFTEHYSAFEAEVQDWIDPDTKINKRLIDNLQSADNIFVAGQASSHCVYRSIQSLANNFGGSKAYWSHNKAEKIIFLSDASSPVKGFENLEEQFLSEMQAKGMRVKTTKDIISQLCSLKD